jgi:hypothetical protein
MERDPVLERALEEAGGAAAVAEYITRKYEPITKQAVYKWRRCPPDRAGQVAEAVRANGGKTTARQLCPDLAKVFARAA